MMYNKKNTCPVCGKPVVYVKINKEGRTIKRAFHEGEMPTDAVMIDIHEISATYRKNLREMIPHDGNEAKAVFDATGMNRFTMITDIINAMKDGGMDEKTANEVRKEMFAKGSNYDTNIETAAKYGMTVIRNH